MAPSGRPPTSSGSWCGGRRVREGSEASKGPSAEGGQLLWSWGEEAGQSGGHRWGGAASPTVGAWPRGGDSAQAPGPLQLWDWKFIASVDLSPKMGHLAVF